MKINYQKVCIVLVIILAISGLYILNLKSEIKEQKALLIEAEVVLSGVEDIIVGYEYYKKQFTIACGLINIHQPYNQLDCVRMTRW